MKPHFQSSKEAIPTKMSSVLGTHLEDDFDE